MAKAGGLADVHGWLLSWIGISCACLSLNDNLVNDAILIAPAVAEYGHGATNGIYGINRSAAYSGIKHTA
jgi:hypothetical protein